MTHRKRSQSGFTLVEVLVTVSLIILIAGALTLPVALQALEKAEEIISGPKGEGLMTTYFDGRDQWTNPLANAPQEVSPTIDFDWGSNEPQPGMGTDNYSVQWRGNITAPQSGNYTFYLRSDDTGQLFIDGKQLVSTTCCRERSASMQMEAGKSYPITINYSEGSGGNWINFKWSGPGMSKQIVASEHLFAGEVGASLTGHLSDIEKGEDAWLNIHKNRVR